MGVHLTNASEDGEEDGGCDVDDAELSQSIGVLLVCLGSSAKSPCPAPYKPRLTTAGSQKRPPGTRDQLRRF